MAWKTNNINEDNKRLILLFATAFLLLFTKLWNGYLGGDEACYATLARQILYKGDWLVLHHPFEQNFASFYEHPPLNIWMSALFFKIFGITDHAAKLFSAFTSLGTIILLFFTGKKLLNFNYGYFAAFILLSTQNYLDRSRQALLDVPLTFFILLSFYFIISCIKDKKYIWAFLGGIASSLAFLSKGIPAFASIAFTGLAFILYSNSVKSIFIYTGFYILGISLLIVPWSILQYIYDNGNFFNWYFFKQVAWTFKGRGVIIEDNFMRVTSYLFYIKKLFIEVMVPWFFFSIMGAYSLYKKFGFEKDKVRYMTIISAVIIFLGFSAAGFKQTGYILPILPYLALLSAEFFIDRIWQENFKIWINRFITGIFLLVIFLGSATNIPFSTKMDGSLVALIPYVKSNTKYGDTILAAGPDEGAIIHTFSWYFERPQIICKNKKEFLEKWESGKYMIGIIYTDNKTDSYNVLNERPSVISGNYYLYLNKTSPSAKHEVVYLEATSWYANIFKDIRKRF